MGSYFSFQEIQLRYEISSSPAGQAPHTTLCFPGHHRAGVLWDTKQLSWLSMRKRERVCRTEYGNREAELQLP